MLKRIIQTAAFGLALAGASAGVHATPIGLALAMDESGSIGIGNFNTQKAGYIAALNNVLPTDGSVAVGVYTFDSSATTVYNFQVINNAADLAALVAAINAIVYNGGGTNIATGIDLAASQMNAFGYGNLEKAIIDVSTDGFGGDPVTAANNFVAAAQAGTASGEAAVNCLGIGAGANCNFETGDNAFEIVGVQFADIQAALELKIRRELGIVPEPGTVLLLGLGLVGLGIRRRLAA